MALALALMALPSLSLSSHYHQLKMFETTIAAAPAVLPDIPQSPPTEQLSPDILPLLPSPGGVVPSSGYFIPTIPSNPSRVPYQTPAFGPDSAFSPLAQLPESSAEVKSLNLAVFVSFVASWSILLCFVV